MTMLFVFLVAILVSVYFNKRRWSLLLIALLAVQLILSGSGIVTRTLLENLQTAPRLDPPNWKERNAIVVLGFGTVKWTSPVSVTSASFAYARIFEGLRLYQSCVKAAKVCRILVTGGDPMRNGEAEGDVMARELVAAGASAQDLIIENKSNNTFQNAKFSAPLLAGFDRIYLVTSGVHIPRAMTFFTHFLNGVTPAPADRMNSLQTILPVSPNLIYFDFAVHEYAGILTYHIYNFMGWNPPHI